ncbi:hypothetical protein V6N13_048734 [Hibiscus sabdariffa]
MKSSHFLPSSFLPQTTPSYCSQISTRDLFVCLLGHVESPSKRSVNLLSRGLVRYGWVNGWHGRDRKRTGIGVSSKLWHGLASDGGKCRRLLMYDEEWFLGSLLMHQRFYAKTKEVFKILVRGSFTVPTISSQMWETLVRDKGDSGVVEVIKALESYCCVYLRDEGSCY